MTKFQHQNIQFVSESNYDDSAVAVRVRSRTTSVTSQANIPPDDLTQVTQTSQIPQTSQTAQVLVSQQQEQSQQLQPQIANNMVLNDTTTTSTNTNTNTDIEIMNDVAARMSVLQREQSQNTSTINNTNSNSISINFINNSSDLFQSVDTKNGSRLSGQQLQIKDNDTADSKSGLTSVIGSNSNSNSNSRSRSIDGQDTDIDPESIITQNESDTKERDKPDEGINKVTKDNTKLQALQPAGQDSTQVKTTSVKNTIHPDNTDITDNTHNSNTTCTREYSAGNNEKNSDNSGNNHNSYSDGSINDDVNTVNINFDDMAIKFDGRTQKLFDLMAKYLILITFCDISTIILLTYWAIESLLPHPPQLGFVLLVVDSCVNLTSIYLQFKFANKKYFKLCGKCHKWLESKIKVKSEKKLRIKYTVRASIHEDIVICDGQQ